MDSKLDKNKLMAELDRNVLTLHRTIDTHRFLVASLLGEGGRDEKELLPLSTSCEKSREEKYRGTLLMAVETIEETRRSFKSRKLEALRKEMMRVLLEAPEAAE